MIGEEKRLLKPPCLGFGFEALVWLRVGSCIIDGEAVCCGDDGMPSFDRTAPDVFNSCAVHHIRE